MRDRVGSLYKKVSGEVGEVTGARLRKGLVCYLRC